MSEEDGLQDRKFHVVGKGREDLERATSAVFNLLETHYVHHYCELEGSEMVLFWNVLYGIHGELNHYYNKIIDVPRHYVREAKKFTVSYHEASQETLHGTRKLCTIRTFEKPLSVGPTSVFLWEWLSNYEYPECPEPETLLPFPKQGFELSTEKTDGQFSDGNKGMLFYVKPVWVA